MNSPIKNSAIFNHEHLLDLLTTNLFSVVFYQLVTQNLRERKFIFITKNVQKQIGYSDTDILKDASIMYNAVEPAFVEVLMQKEKEAADQLKSFIIDFQIQAKDGVIKWLQLRSVPTLLDDGSILWDGIQTDITEIKESERKLYKANRELQLLNKINDRILVQTNIQTLFDNVCKCIVEEGKYVLAWISKKPDENELDQVAYPIAKFGEIRYLEEIKIDLSDPEQKCGPTATALLIGKPVITNNFKLASNTKPWKAAALKYNIASSIVLPIQLSLVNRGTLNIYSNQVDAFDLHEQQVLERIAENVSLSVKNILITQERENVNFLLNERIKEIRTLYVVSKTLQNSALSVEQVLQDLVEMIPLGWQFPTICYTKITIHHQVYTSSNYEDSTIHLKADILTPRGKVGYLEVGYTCMPNSRVASIFLHEEQNLIHVLAKLIADYYDWRVVQEALIKSEANLSTIFNNTEIGYVLLDIYYKVVSYNHSMKKGFAEQLGIVIQEGDDFLSVLPSDKVEIKKESFIKCVAEKNALTYEVSYSNHDDTKFYTVNINPIIDNDVVLGVCLSAFDITKRKNLEIESQKITQDLIQRNRDLEQFAYILSHNIRAPLANILGLNELLSAPLSLKEKEDVLLAIKQSAELLDVVVRDISKILQVRKDIGELKEEVQFEEITKAIIDSIGNIIEDKHIQISFDFSKAKWCFSIKSYVVSVFQNLIVNAIKYSNPNVQPLLHIESKKDNDYILISFKDNGMGIDLQKYGDQIFGLYKRFHHQIDGKGMGLYMVKTQLQTIGGSITVNSTLGEGTEFIINIPL